MISIRTGNTSDFVLLTTLGRRAFYEAFGEHNNPDDMQVYLDLAFNSETIREQLDDPEVVYFIASCQDDPVGYTKLKRNSFPPELKDMKCIQLERIYALQAYIGKKIGKHLMEQCIETGKKENFEYLWLGVWQENERAISFYKKWGFEVIGTKQFIIGKEVNDDFVMALDIR
jgi:ribosomal protein S18 acetylase RimI-like enzyme